MYKENETFIVDMYAIQVLPPSCVNRDDTGSPKTAMYGGVTRGRISSQCLKNAMRGYVRKHIKNANLGVRTEYVVRLLCESLCADDPSLSKEKAETVAWGVITSAGLGKKDKDKLATLLYVSSGDLDLLLNTCKEKIASEKKKAEQKTDKKKKENDTIIENLKKDLAKSTHPWDMALFGRMIAGDKSLCVEASAQVAHAISTHAVTSEFDFFSATDDAQDTDNTGSAYIDTAEFNSFTMYRYASVNVRELMDAYEKDAAEAISTFLEAFVKAMPTGKIHSYANSTLPEFVYVTIRRDQPLNLVGAFEEPVKMGASKGYLRNSVKQFIDYTKAMYENIAGEPEHSYCATLQDSVEGSEKVSIPVMLDRVRKNVQEFVQEINIEDTKIADIS